MLFKIDGARREYGPMIFGVKRPEREEPSAVGISDGWVRSRGLCGIKQELQHLLKTLDVAFRKRAAIPVGENSGTQKKFSGISMIEGGLFKMRSVVSNLLSHFFFKDALSLLVPIRSAVQLGK